MAIFLESDETQVSITSVSFRHEVLSLAVSEVGRSGVHEVTTSHTDNVDHRYPIELPASDGQHGVDAHHALGPVVLGRSDRDAKLLRGPGQGPIHG